MNYKTEQYSMTGRKEALAERGYPEELIAQLSDFSEEELDTAAGRIFSLVTVSCIPQEQPHVIFLGGQTGAGKSTWSRRFRASSEYPYAEIALDNYRTAHPRYCQMEKAILSYWNDRLPDDDNSPGNDIADFTHAFAGAVTDRLIERAAQQRLNMILEWGLRNPEEPLKLMERLKAEGYCITVIYIAADPQTSMDACRLRADLMNSGSHIMRRVTKQFHDLTTAAMPESCRIVYKTAVGQKLCGDFRILTREGECLWSVGQPGTPDVIYQNYLSHIPDHIFNDPEEGRHSLKEEQIGLRIV